MRIDNKYTRIIGDILLLPFVPIVFMAFLPLFLMIWFNQKFIKRCDEWENYYLWFPRQIGFEGSKGRYYWLQTVERKWHYNNYEYRIKGEP